MGMLCLPGVERALDAVDIERVVESPIWYSSILFTAVKLVQDI